ncbi:MAG: helix-turn-helix domain-containing protein [Patulibacter minatonensis]
MRDGPITRSDVMPMEEVCEIVGLSRDTVRKRAQAGTIPSVKVGRTPIFLRADVTDWLLSHRRGVDQAADHG